MIKISIAGDFVPRNRITTLIDEDKYEEVFGEIKNLNEAMDYRIVNLECPVVNGQTSSIHKVGPTIYCRERDIQLLKYGLFDGVTLANNHFYDYGEQGVKDTLETLNSQGIDYVGGGRNIKEASATLYKSFHGETLAIVNCCEHEFSIADDTKGGSNPLNPISQYYAIVEARKKADHVIVIIHGGVEKYWHPTPRMRQTYRFFIDIGADAVVNHHQHRYCGMETYKAKPIFYGLGNFCFDLPWYRHSFWNKGYMVLLQMDGEKVEYQVKPYIQCGETPDIRFLQGESEKEFFERFQKRSDELTDEKKLAQAFQGFVDGESNGLSVLMTPYTSKRTKWLFQKGLLPALYPKKKLLTLLNIVECESHRERLIHYIKNKLNRE